MHSKGDKRTRRAVDFGPPRTGRHRVIHYVYYYPATKMVGCVLFHDEDTYYSNLTQSICQLQLLGDP